MRRTILIASGSALVLGLLGLVLFGTALARPAPRTDTAKQVTQQEQEGCHDDSAMWGSLAKALGISESQLRTELEAGKSLKDIAKAQGLDEQKLSAALNSAMQDEVRWHVESGHLSQDEADAMLKHMEQMGPNHLIDMMGGEMHGDMGEMHSGMMDGDAPGMMDDEGDSCHADSTTTM